MRRAPQSPPSTWRFIIALRLWARTMIAHHAALAPNSPLGSRPPARSSFITACASSLLPIVRPDGEFDHPEALVLALGAILQKTLLIAGRIRAQVKLRYAARQQARRLFENAQLLVPGRNIAVAELRMHDQALLRPPGVERLIGLEALVTVQRLTLVRLDQRGVHVERRLRRRALRLNRPQKLAVHPPQAGHARARRRDERPSGFPPRLLAGIVKSRKPSPRRMRRGQRARPLPPPPPRLGPPFRPAPPIGFRRSHQPTQTAVRLQPVEIVETIAPGKVQQD